MGILDELLRSGLTHWRLSFFILSVLCERMVMLPKTSFCFGNVLAKTQRGEVCVCAFNLATFMSSVVCHDLLKKLKALCLCQTITETLHTCRDEFLQFLHTPYYQFVWQVCVWVCLHDALLTHINQRWDKVIVLQVTSKSQVFTLKYQIRSQVNAGKSRVKSKVLYFEFWVLIKSLVLFLHQI